MGTRAPLSLDAATEARLFGAVAAVLGSRCCGDDEAIDLATESIVADVTEDGAPADAEEARDRFEAILAACGVAEASDSESSDDVGGGGVDGGVFAELRVAVARATTAEEDEEDYLRHDQCEMCERVTPLTKHHLFPRSQAKHFEKRGFCPPGRSLLEVAAVCRQCHSAIHAFADERELGERYNTMESLLAEEQLAKHARYLSKQRARSVRDGHNTNLRHAK